MAPAARPDPGVTPCFKGSRLISAISSLFKPKPSLRPSFRTPKKEKGESINLMDTPVPPIYPTPLTPSRLPTPTGFELKPAGPEKEPWMDIPSLQGTDDFDELMSNHWDHKHKRSSNFSPSMTGMSMMLTY